MLTSSPTREIDAPHRLEWCESLECFVTLVPQKNKRGRFCNPTSCFVPRSDLCIMSSCFVPEELRSWLSLIVEPLSSPRGPADAFIIASRLASPGFWFAPRSSEASPSGTPVGVSTPGVRWRPPLVTACPLAPWPLESVRIRWHVDFVPGASALSPVAAVSRPSLQGSL